MFRQHQASKSIGHPSEQRSAGVRGPTRTFRLSLFAFLLLVSTPLGLGILMSVPPARLAGSLGLLSDTWTHILSAAEWRSDSPQSPAAGMSSSQNTRPSWAVPIVPRDRDHNILSYGDRLKITFYESLGVTIEERSSNPDQPVATIFPRMDLSAEYLVDEGGSLAIPKLGHFKAAHQTVTALQSTLATAFERTIGRSSDVHIAIVERQPIYVIGTVRNAGTFKHTPGMTVLQALANAGGTNSGTADVSKAIESIRETQRLRETEARLDRLLLTQARLTALRDDADGLTVPASIIARLSGMAQQEGLKTLIAGAQATLTEERVRYRQEMSLAQRQVGIARTELEAQNVRAEQLKLLLAKKSDRLRDLEAIAARGSVSQYKLTDVGVDISDSITRREDTRVALAQSERRLVEAEIALAKIQLDHSAGINRELSATQQEIDNCRQAIVSMQAVTEVLRDGTSDVAGASSSTPFLRITRRVADGITVMAATESTGLLPGDVVQVNFVGGSDASVAGSSQDTTHLRN